MKRTRLQKSAAVCLVFGLLVAAGGGSGIRAGEASSVGDDVAMVQPFIGETTTLVLKVDPTRVSLPDLPSKLKSAVPGVAKAYHTLTRGLAHGIEIGRAAVNGQTVYATVGIPLSETEWPAFFFVKETPGVDRKLLTDRLDVSLSVQDGLIVAMPLRDVDVTAALGDLTPSPRQDLADAFAAVHNYPIQMLVLPPDYVRRTIIELMPELPRQFGGGPSNVLTDGLIWAALGVDLAKLQAELVIQSRSPEAAQALAKHLPKMLQSAYDAVPDLKTQVPANMFAALLTLIQPKVEGDRVTMRIGLGSTSGNMQLIALLATAVQEGIRRQTNSRSFKQILIAIHNYHDVYKMFPPRNKARDDSGKSGLSWRVHILPFLDEMQLYEKFHLDEPWDSPHNKPLVKTMPKVYKNHRLDSKPGHTTFLAPIGKDTIFGGQKATAFFHITDGTSNTVALVEVKPNLAVPWTAPRDYAFDPKAPGRGLAVGVAGRFDAALADGSVHKLRADVDPKVLLNLFKKSDGQVIDWKAIR